MKKIRIIALFSLVCLLFLIPATHAMDNQTVVADTNESDVLSGEYYFDANVVDDTGNGSADNPYKEFTANRISDNSVIHLANGEYTLNYKTSVRNVTIIGEDTQNTVISYNRNVIGFNVYTYIGLQNMTLNGLPISDSESITLEARNVIFKNTLTSSITVDSANTKVYLENCTFYNNGAQRGGAININRCGLVMDNCSFISNYAQMWGGAIVAENGANITIRKSKFLEDYSRDNVAGAIYIRESELRCIDVEMISCTSTMGGAIASLDSALYLTNLTARNNNAKYSGGAVYALFGVLNLYNSTFINNTAKDGGALFVDEVYDLVPFYNHFANNTASGIAGAVYSAISSGLDPNSFLEDLFDNSFSNNSAAFENDLYECEAIRITSNSTSYILIRSNPYDGPLPSSYDLRKLNLVTPVRNQGSNGNCWAFAALASLESCILKATGDAYDLSEANMKNLMASFSSYGWSIDTNDGGYDRMGYGYLVSWLGPVLESDDKYILNGIVSPVMESFIHVQNILFLKRSSFTDNDEIKRAIMSYGAVETCIHTYRSNDDGAEDYYTNGKNLYWYRTDKGANHAVAIVGWDDSYSKDNFKTKPPGDGAWIVKNSWGTGSGEAGYWYVSYYDTCLAPVNSLTSTYVFVFNDTMKYDKNYQYDVAGRTDFFLNSSDTVWYKNRFNASDMEYLTAVSTFFEKDTEWDLFIYVNDVLRHTQSGRASPSYSTIELSEFIPLDVGDVFDVVFKIKVDNEAGVPISESVSLNKELYHRNISFISYDGVSWVDFYDLEWSYSTHVYDSQVACIKAFTVLNPIGTSVELSLEIVGDERVDLIAKVYNEAGYLVNRGNLTFNIYGTPHTVEAANGIFRFSNIALNEGISNFTAQFSAVGFSPCDNFIVINFTKMSTTIDLNFSGSLNPIEIIASLNSSFNVNVYVGEVIFSINGINHTVNVSEGIARMTELLDKDCTNNVTATYCGSYGYDSTKPTFELYYFNSSNITRSLVIELVDTDMILSFSGQYNPVTITASVTDRKGNGVSSGTICFTVEGVVYPVAVVDGHASLVHVFKNIGLNSVAAEYSDRYKYAGSTFNRDITVRTTVISANAKKAVNAPYTFTLLDSNGNPLKNTNVNVVISGATHKLTTNDRGVATITLSMNPNSYSIKITNPSTGEVKTPTVNVVKRIAGSGNLYMYYGAGSSYKVRVFDDNGNVAKNVKVAFTIKGKTYYRWSDSNGYAYYKIALNPGKYWITAAYKGCKVSNKITVKSTIITGNIKVKKGKAIQFTAKLLNSKGKILKYKKITFKFKGKTYKIKTNNKGVATLKIKPIYKTGKYAITSSYGGLKISNTIKIK